MEEVPLSVLSIALMLLTVAQFALLPLLLFAVAHVLKHRDAYAFASHEPEAPRATAASGHAPARPGRERRFTFKGTASEYFRIWIVNVGLTVLTLGFYGAWAKVRTRQFFYGNTYLPIRSAPLVTRCDTGGS